MTLLDALSQFALLLLLFVAAHSDLRTRRIPNRLTLGGFVAGAALGLVAGGPGGLAGALLGGAVGLALFFVLYALGALGAGDVKLLAAAGTFLGFPLVAWAAVCSAVAGGLLALVLVLHRGALRQVAANLGGLLWTWAGSRGLRKVEWLTVHRADALKVPYGVAIAAGCAFAALFPELSVF